MLKIIDEASAKIEAPDQKIVDRKMEVFYNPVMKLNRDITVLLLKVLEKKDMKIADPLSGSGVRALRLLKELDSYSIKTIMVNDKREGFSEYMEKIISLNGLDHEQKSKFRVFQKDANIFLINNKPFDYIDIDPFGTPNPFLDSAARSIQGGGILAVTATDTSALCGSYPKACRRKYWAEPLRNYLMHEIGLRILIRKIQLIGAHHQRALQPIISYSKDHYMRIFFKFEKGKQNIDRLLLEHKTFLYEKKEYGPLWTGKLNDSEILRKMILLSGNKENEEHSKDNKTSMNKESLNLINFLYNESEIDGIGFIDVHEISREFKGKTIPKFESIMESLREKGFKCSRTHFRDTGIKTNASKEEFLEVYKGLVE